jgi:hypothetical protein
MVAFVQANAIIEGERIAVPASRRSFPARFQFASRARFRKRQLPSSDMVQT